MPTNRGAILVNGRKAAALLDISYKQFTRLLPRLKAAGLKVVEVPSSIRGGRPTVRYVSKSIDAMIDRAARREESLC
ncbi:MAG: hypothetical protein ABFD92_16620 [Planctomycetaceae bacterium]|nr:hypothetical protein [Planctomycetaceae bacterium]